MKQAGFIAAIVVSASALTAGIAIAQGPGGKHPDRMSFSELDANGDGQITREEIDQMRAAKFAEGDADKDGKLSLEEMQAAARQRADDRAKAMLSRLDDDNDGFLSPEEMPGQNRTGRMFERLDADDSGGISEEEFADIRSKMRSHRRNAPDQN